MSVIITVSDCVLILTCSPEVIAAACAPGFVVGIENAAVPGVPPLPGDDVALGATAFATFAPAGVIGIDIVWIASLLVGFATADARLPPSSRGADRSRAFTPLGNGASDPSAIVDDDGPSAALDGAAAL